MKLVNPAGLMFCAAVLTLSACNKTSPPKTEEFSPVPRDEAVVQSVIDSFADDALYFTGNYPNLIIELGLATESEAQARVQEIYQNFFYTEPTATDVDPSDPSVQGDYALMYPVGEDMAFINAIDSNDIRSEGMSYGMIITVMMDDQDAFDKLWKFAKTKMQHTEGDQYGYFAWHLSNEAPFEVLDANPAPDGEEWFVQALFLAHHRWGSGDGIFNYEKEANELLELMVHKPENETSYPLMNREHQMITFVNTKELHQYTDPSYHTPAFYELWAVWADHNNQYWHDAAQISRDYLPKNAHPTTGLFSDYASFEGVPEVTTFNEHSHRAAFDSHRVIANLAMDYLWISKDPVMKELATRNLDHFAYVDQNEGGYVSVNEVDGTPLVTYKAHSQVGMNAVGAMIYDGDYRDEFITQLWNYSQPAGQWRYYNGLLYMMGMLHVTGNFKIFGDGVVDTDGDGYGDLIDAFPFDSGEWVDTDGDTIGNNADNDDDNDGVVDTEDAFPLNSNETVDTDGDGIGNNADTDDDNDGIPDSSDPFPLEGKMPAFSFDFTDGISNTSGSWTARDDNAPQDYGTQPTHNATDGTLTITPSWSANDTFTIKFQQFAATDITGGGDLQLDLKLDAAYVNDGNMVVQLFLEDASYNGAYIGYTNVSSLTADEFVTLRVTDITSESFYDGGPWANPAFDFSQVRAVGIQIQSNTDLSAITAPIEIDNVALLVPPSLESLVVDNVSDINGWVSQTDNVGGGSVVTASLTHNATDGALVVTPTWGAADSDQLAVKFTGFDARNIHGSVTLSYQLKLAQTYIDDGSLWLQVLLEDNQGRPAYFNTSTAGAFASDAFTQITIANVGPSTPFGYIDGDFDFANVSAVGLQFVSAGKPVAVTGDIEILEFMLTY